MGAHAVPGVYVDNANGGDDYTIVIGGDYDKVPGSKVGSGRTVVAEAVTNEDMAQELREQLRSEIQHELQEQMRNQIVTAEVVSAEGDTTIASASQQAVTVPPPRESSNNAKQPFWTKKRCLIAIPIVLLLVAGGAVGALFAIGSFGGHDANQKPNTDGDSFGGELAPSSSFMPVASPFASPVY